MRVCALLFLAFAVLAGCGTAPNDEGAAREAKAFAAPLTSGAAEAQARLLSRLAPRLEQSSASLTRVTRKDGGRSLRMNGRFSHAQIARLHSDGTVTRTCVDHLEAAEAALRGAQP